MRPDCTFCQAGTHHYHASDLGRCGRETVGELLGEKLIPHDAATERRFVEGRLHERDVIEDRLPAQGYEVTDSQTERILTLAGIPVMTRVDGRIAQLGEIGVLNPRRVLEVKAPGKAEFVKWMTTRWDTPGLWQNYKWATSCYMLAWESELQMAVKNRETGELDLSVVLETPFYSRIELDARVAWLEHHFRDGELPATCPRDFFCRMKWSCPREESAGLSPGGDERRPPPPSVVTYVELGKQIASLTAERDALKGEMEAVLGGAESVAWQGYKASRVVRENKERVVPASRSEYIKVSRIEQKEED